MSGEKRSIWQDAIDLQEDEVRDKTRSLLELAPVEREPSRFVTVIGSSDEHPDLSLLTALVEMTRFGKQFDNEPKELQDLYGHLGETICILAIDTRDPDNPRPASTSRLAIGSLSDLDHLPSMMAIQADAGPGANYYAHPVWHISEDDMKRGVEELETASGVLLDGSTIASMPEYADGSASFPIFSAYARMTANQYRGFEGVFLSTMVDIVSEIIADAAGCEILHKFPGTTPETFYGAPGTAPLIGTIDLSKFGEKMSERVSTEDHQKDVDGSSYVFL